jgi:hypothetical protein
MMYGCLDVGNLLRVKFGLFNNSFENSCEEVTWMRILKVPRNIIIEQQVKITETEKQNSSKHYFFLQP